MKVRIVEKFDCRYSRTYQWRVEIRKSFFSGWMPYVSCNSKEDAYKVFNELQMDTLLRRHGDRVIEEVDLG